MFFFGRATTLTCKRVEPTQGRCELAEASLLGSQFREISLNQLYGAEVETSTSSDDSDTYRVALLTSDGKIPFPVIYSSGYETKQTTASRIDAFVLNPGEASLAIQDDSRWFAYPFGALFVAAGLFVVSMGQAVTCTFDKPLDRMSLKRQGLLGTKVIERSHREILAARVEVSTDGEGDSTYRVSLALVSGDLLPLTSYYSRGKESKQKAVDYIQTFLKG